MTTTDLEAQAAVPYRVLLVPYDFSNHSRAALEAAIALARPLGADCHLLHVVQPYFTPYAALPGAVPPPPPNMLEVCERSMESLRHVASEFEQAPGEIVAHVVEEANVSAGVCQLAEKIDADLIVMGTHGRTGIAHVFLGSVAERTLRTAPCHVLTVRARTDSDHD